MGEPVTHSADLAYPTSDARLTKVAKIQNWIDKCSEKHTRQCTQHGSPILPKRLIYFSNDPMLERLVSVSQLPEPPQYIALSYCWGRTNNFQTKHADLPKWELEIPHTLLPQTIKDIFYIVRQLGYSYLWIDALCIVQDKLPDSRHEWDTEAAKMGDVYANATLVIAAMASASVQAGCFVHNAAPITQPSEDAEKSHKIMTTCRTMTQKEWHGIRETYPLLCRGWAFQERLLARRIVHFTLTELIWECAEDRWCECGYLGTGKQSGQINNLMTALRECREHPTDTKTRLMWRECVKSFSKRDLTVMDDRAYAIQGIASYLRGPDTGVYDREYFYGLWRDALPWDLLWYCDSTSLFKNKKSSRGPSYSWLSVDCGIEWPACEHWENPRDKFSIAISTGTCFEFKSEDRWVCECTVAADDTLVLTSRMTPVIIKRQNGAQVTSWVVEDVRANNDQSLPFYPDILLENEDSQPPIQYYYVEIARTIKHSPIRRAGLIIRPKCIKTIESKHALYERIGMAGNISCNLGDDYRGWAADGQVHTIHLV